MVDQMKIAMAHANEASEWQSRVDALQEIQIQEAEKVEAASREITALEAQAMLEERRAAQEQRVRNVLLKCTEAGLQDVQTNMVELVEEFRHREQEEKAEQACVLRQLRRSNAKEVQALQEVELAHSREEAREREEGKASRLVVSLRKQHASDMRRLSADEESLSAEVALMRGELEGRSQALERLASECHDAEFAAQHWTEVATSNRRALVRARLRFESERQTKKERSDSRWRHEVGVATHERDLAIERLSRLQKAFVSKKAQPHLH